MPKLGVAKCLDPQSHQASITELLRVIAKKFDKRHGDVVIAYEEDISVYAVRMWLARPIPKKHWKALSKLSGYSTERIERIARQYFDMHA